VAWYGFSPDAVTAGPPVHDNKFRSLNKTCVMVLMVHRDHQHHTLAVDYKTFGWRQVVNDMRLVYNTIMTLVTDDGMHIKITVRLT